MLVPKCKSNDGAADLAAHRSLCPTIHRRIAFLMLAAKVCHLNGTHLIRLLVSPCWAGHEFPCYDSRSTSRQLFLNRFNAKSREVSQAPTIDSLY
ncbi:MAG: hypothetical protein CBB71_06805 [Rhodopirellula sp. TMED11]|nr:MAG: hypothetical protein CBB71_06805 [Rhodopirellula sp. TMED11]